MVILIWNNIYIFKLSHFAVRKLRESLFFFSLSFKRNFSFKSKGAKITRVNTLTYTENLVIFHIHILFNNLISDCRHESYKSFVASSRLKRRIKKLTKSSSTSHFLWVKVNYQATRQWFSQRKTISSPLTGPSDGTQRGTAPSGNRRTDVTGF